jgi:hypothetical protein
MSVARLKDGSVVVTIAELADDHAPRATILAIDASR